MIFLKIISLVENQSKKNNLGWYRFNQNKFRGEEVTILVITLI